MTLAIDKLNRCGLSNTVHGKEDKVDTILAIDGGILTTNNTECFSYKGEYYHQ